MNLFHYAIAKRGPLSDFLTPELLHFRVCNSPRHIGAHYIESQKGNALPCLGASIWTKMGNGHFIWFQHHKIPRVRTRRSCW